jgi:hypothetical protein
VEKILCAAIWYKDEKTPDHNVANVNSGLVLCGYRHCHIIAQYSVMRGRTAGTNHEQGFLTSNNRFVNREEGGKIAFAAGQTESLKTSLYSEDVYLMQ